MADTHLVRAVLKIALIIGIFAALYLARHFLVTLSLAALLALLFDPFQNWLERRGWSRNWSTTLCTAILLLFIGGVLFGLGRQVASFAQDWPKIKQQVYERIEQVRNQMASNAPSSGFAGTSASSQNADSTARQAQENTSGEQGSPQADSSAQSSGNSGGGGLSMNSVGTQRITQVLSGTFAFLGNFLLFLVYFVLLLSQKDRLREFMLRRFSTDQRAEVAHTINESVKVASSYMVGRLLSVLFLAVIYCTGFSIIGLRNGIFIGAFGALLEMIPFIGNIIAGVLALAMAVISGGDTTQLLAVAGIMIVGQFLESYILEPLVVGRKVDLNPLTTIVIVVIFTIMWGPLGAIVAIPIAGIARIIFSHIPGLKDYAFLLGEEPVKS